MQGDLIGRPEPDVAVISGTQLDYLDGHPAEALLIVEVSGSSLSYDRGRKLAAYARNRVPEYWLVDLRSNTLEVYREPSGDSYGAAVTLRHGDDVAPVHVPEATIGVASLLP